MIIEGVNGGGGTNQASVDSAGKLQTKSVSEDTVFFAVSEGRAYESYTGVMNFASDLKQMVLYMKNNEDKPIFVTVAELGTRKSTGGTDDIIFLEQVGNIASTDPIVSGTDASTVNRNTGNASLFDGDVKKGPVAVSGNEFTAKGVFGDFTQSRTFNMTIEVPKGGTMGIAVTPPTGNTSMDMTLIISFHVKEF